MIELTEDHRAALEGLEIAHRNPGQVDQDVIQYLWEKMNRSAVELNRLALTGSLSTISEGPRSVIW